MATKIPLEKRIENFKIEVQEKAAGVYPDEMVKEFLDYWTEHNEKGRKFRREMVKNNIFDINKRLATWYKNARGKYKRLDETIQKDDKFKKLREEYGLE